MRTVGKAGSQLNVVRLSVAKMVILTNEAQPPNTPVTGDGLILKVVERNQRQKWLEGIMHATRLIFFVFPALFGNSAAIETKTPSSRLRLFSVRKM